jgi:hypothetical protein
MGIVLSVMTFWNGGAGAQTIAVEQSGNGFRIGERLTYNISMGRFAEAGYAELHTVSRGRLGDKDAIELRSKFKTLELASAAFYLIDENRTTFAAPGSGLPLYTSVNQNAFGLPKETIQNFLAAPTAHLDLLTLIHRIRQSGGNGSATLQENEKVYSVTFQSGLIERQKTGAGEFETTVVALQSELFTEYGISNVRINISNDESKLPVLIRCKMPKGSFKALLASVQNLEPEVAVQPTPAPARTPVPDRTPKPQATPAPYVDNLPLAPELAFELGEALEYRIVSGVQQVAKMTLSAVERKEFNGLDSLLLQASFSDVRTGAPFAAGDFIKAYVDPDTLAPRQIEMKFAGELRAFSGMVKFEKQGSEITFGGTGRVDSPVGTHSVLSLLYAARSFNLKPSRDLNNPINDTRVAVFWESQPYIFTLRPSPIEIITVDQKQVAAQLVTITTKNVLLDRLNFRVWLGTYNARIPVRLILGAFQADLVSASKLQFR